MRATLLLPLLALLGSQPGIAAADDVVEYYHLDALGNVRVITDEAGDVVERHDYYPFGEECTTGPCASNPGAGAGHPLKFTGKERDAETGLDYFGARYYGSWIGRFTTVDPYFNWKANTLEPQRWNRYAYVTNNPLRFTDPDGRDKVAEFFLGEAGKDVNTFEVIFSQQTVTDVYGGAQTFAEEHGALTGGFSPVPTGKGDLIFAVGGLKPAKGLGQIHHIATNKSIKSGFTKQFEEIFGKAGKSLQDAANKMFLEGHAGRHSPAYHRYVLDRLRAATAGLEGSEYDKALTGALESVGNELKKSPDLVKGVGLQ